MLPLPHMSTVVSVRLTRRMSPRHAAEISPSLHRTRLRLWTPVLCRSLGADEKGQIHVGAHNNEISWLGCQRLDDATLDDATPQSRVLLLHYGVHDTTLCKTHGRHAMKTCSSKKRFSQHYSFYAQSGMR